MPRRVLFIGLALILSVAAFLLLQMWSRGHSGAPGGRAGRGTPTIPVTRVLVANVELPAGSVLRGDQLRWEPWPSASAATYVVEGRARPADFEGSVLRSHLAPGEPIVPGQVAHPGERGFLAAVLEPGDSAVTINVTPSSGMAGFLVPGDRADVLLTMTVPAAVKEAPPHHVSEVLVANVRVVGVDQSFSQDKKTDKKDVTAPKTVTLEVTPKQAQVIAVGADIGNLSISLRSLGAPAAEPLPMAESHTWDVEATHLFPPQASTAVPAAKARSAPAPTPQGLRIFRG